MTDYTLPALETTTTRIVADLRAIIRQGGDPAIYAASLAARHGVPVETIRALAQGMTLRTVDAETVAQERLADDRESARRPTVAWRAYQHDED